MLNKPGHSSSVQVVAVDEPVMDLVEGFRVLRRQGRLFATVLMLTIGVAIVYLMVTPARYTASALVIFDIGNNTGGVDSRVQMNSEAESSYVDSQVEVLKSDAIARSVIRKLHLDTDAEFLAPGNPILSAISRFGSWLFGMGTERDPDADRLAPFIAFFHANLTIKRVGLTYVAEVAFRSIDRAKAARISNAVIDAYAVAQLDSKYQAAGQVATWLHDRVEELRTRAQDAEKAVAEYKAQNRVDDTKPLTEAELATLSGQRRAKLKDLESTAQTYRTLHEAFVQRATQQQAFPSTDARVISKATPPIEKSDPKTLLVLAAAILLGAVGGAAAAFTRDRLRGAFVSSGQVEKELQTSCLGVFPALAGRKAARPATRGAPVSDVAPLPDHATALDVSPRAICRDPQGYTRAVDDPYSLWSEAIRFIAVEMIGLKRPGSVIGIGSALAREGKSMVAANFAELIAEAGRKVLLIDCNLRNSELTRRFAPEATTGLLDVIASREPNLQGLVWRDPLTGLHFLPAPPALAPALHPAGAISSSQMQKMLTSAQDEYDHIILDLPAVLSAADVKAASYFIDSFILVIEWGRTPQSAVHDALNAAPLLAGKLLGAVLNNASPSVLMRLQSYSGPLRR